MDCKASWDNSQVGFSLSLLFSRVNNHSSLGLPRQEMLLYLNCPCGLSVDSPWYIHVFLVLGNLKLNTRCQVWPQQCQVQWKDHLPQLADTPVSNGAHSLPVPQGHFVGSGSTWCPPGLFLPRCFPATYIPPYWWTDLSFPKCRILLLLSCMKFLSAHFSQQ